MGMVQPVERVGKKADAGAGVRFAAQVFDVLADRFAERATDIALFADTGCSFEAWCLWEGLAALRAAGRSVEPRPRYTNVGVTGSREHADLLVVDPTRGCRTLVELAVIHDWTTNKWIDDLDGDTQRLARPLAAGVTPLQLILTASLTSPVQVNPTWRRWLEMSVVWKRPGDLKRTLPLGTDGELALYGWTKGKRD